MTDNLSVARQPALPLFDEGIAAPPVAPAATATTGRLYLTSDLRRATGLPRTHMDYYLRAGLVRPASRTEGGYLLFDEAELTTLRAILRWRQDGLGIKEIRERLGR